MNSDVRRTPNKNNHFLSLDVHSIFISLTVDVQKVVFTAFIRIDLG